MTKIRIDDREFELESLSDAAKAQLNMLKLAETKIAELQRDMALVQTARNAYFNALKELLPTPLDQVMAQGETLKVS